MKSFIRAITITIVLNLIPAGSATAQTAPAAVSQQVVSEVEEAMAVSDLDDMLMQLHIARAGQFGGEGILVIPTAEIKPQDVVTIMEDIAVMCRIFDKKLAQSRLIPGQFLSTSSNRIRLSTAFSRDSRSTGAMYVQGYGTLFLTKVDFPLSPPPQAQQEKETKEEDVDPVWEQMKRQMYEPEEVRRRKVNRSAEKYDAERVENLKTTLIKALKHAANIRGLKPDESVIFSVTGKAGQSANIIIKQIPETNKVIVIGEDKKPRIYVGGLPGNLAFSSPTVLTIRAKKSDIDAFAKGQLDFDQFRQKTQLLSYPYLGGNIGGGPSRSFPTNIIY